MFITHTEIIRKIFGAAVDGDSASIAYQADQLAQKLDREKADLLAAAKRAEGHARDLQRALASTDPLESQSSASSAALLAQSATECARRSERTEALDTGLFALVRAAGKGKQYVEAKRGAQ